MVKSPSINIDGPFTVFAQNSYYVQGLINKRPDWVRSA